MKKQYLVIGAGRFGQSIATTLYELGNEVLVVDSDQESVEQIADMVTHAVTADASDENALKALGIRNFDTAIVAIGNIQYSILVTLLCKENGVNRVIAKAMNELHAKVLYRIGADKVVFPERDMGEKIARGLSNTNMLEFLELSDEYSLAEFITLPKWVGKSIREINVRARYGVNIIAIRNMDGRINVSPSGDDIIREGDVIIVIGSNKDIEKFESN